MRRTGKTSQGRRKVEMKKIEGHDARQVYFLKLKKDIFMKACELYTMCGAEVAVLIHSPNGAPYTFGSLSVDRVFNQIMTRKHYLAPADPNVNNAINQLNQEYMELSKLLHAAETRRGALEEQIKRAAFEAKECEWLGNIDQLNRGELLKLLGSLYRSKSSINERMRELPEHTNAGPSNMYVFTNMQSNTEIVGDKMNQEVPPSLNISDSPSNSYII